MSFVWSSIMLANRRRPDSNLAVRVTPADRGESQSVLHPASAPLDSSLRWNDNGVWENSRGTKGMAIHNKPVIPAQARLHGCTPTGM